mmetsp:Transcript_112710/g.218407  ORF Transcript_112710/g.218407 Transcript_112710/m.218407 type:complete len:251 (+) Transcript_112710:70-822(+)
MGCGCGTSQAGQVQNATTAKKERLPATIAAASRGRFQSALPSDHECRRDFARIFFADQRKIFLIARGMPSMRPLQPTAGPSSAHVGDLSEQVIERAGALFSEALSAALTQACGSTPDEGLVRSLRLRAMASMSVNVGIDFALHMQLMPAFLQPFFLIIVLGDLTEARTATYGFIAASPGQIQGDRPESKRSPFCVRLLSPNLLAAEAEPQNWEVQYRVKEVRCSSIVQAAKNDENELREAVARASWDCID